METSFDSLLRSLGQDVYSVIRSGINKYCKHKLNNKRYNDFLDSQKFETEHLMVNRELLNGSVKSVYMIIVAYKYIDGNFVPVTKMFIDAGEKAHISISSSWVHFHEFDARHEQF